MGTRSGAGIEEPGHPGKLAFHFSDPLHRIIKDPLGLTKADPIWGILKRLNGTPGDILKRYSRYPTETDGKSLSNHKESQRVSQGNPTEKLEVI